ncbi:MULTISPECIES: MFS transporter [Streptomyces]|uniref:MFS transporter n=1 Tax=Streptomyces TaxID=1883 RepID=UPI00081F0BDA|nr:MULTISPECIES: MFS transporter [unclassified Streptomyces]MYQ93985.1 MFS transporter [Streptomyces sp. SID4946]SCF83745.1 Predicted arabinose efflux permease, MFS family [Streptomyces sp. LamerLS-31b]SCF85905.1 Predicted arabinose efflux permease, MFS family [Streptomyces sp. DconLS]
MDVRARLRELTLMSASSITIIGTTAIAASLPEMEKRFAHTPHAGYLVGLSLTLPALAAGVCAPVMGAIVDRFGRKRLFVIALSLYGIAGCAGFVLEDLYMIMVSRFVLGVAVSGVATCATVLIADHAKRGHLGRLMGRQSLFMALGNIMFVFAGGLLALNGWHWPFLLYAVGLALIPGVVLLFGDQGPAQPDGAPAPPARVEPAAARDGASSPAGPARLRTMAWVYFLLFLNMVIYFMVPVHLPFYLKELTDDGSAQAGAMLSLVGLCWALASPLYGWLEKRLSHAQIVVLTFGGSAAANVLLGAADGYILAIPALALLGASLGLSITNLNTWLFTLAPVGAKGRVVGTRVFFTFIGQFFSPVLTGPLTATFGFGPSYVAAGCLLAAVVVGTQIGLTAKALRATGGTDSAQTQERGGRVGAA